MRALIVDDSSAMRAYLKMILKSFGFETSEAKNGREGLQLMKNETAPALVLLDWNMPEMDGFTMLRELRAVSRFQNVKVMMVTTETEMAEMSRALGAGADEYVMKPFTREVIADKLQMLGLTPITQ
ncbi:MAG TPA: response regulator [Candidatus Koribacter sp.]|jgi:two-component system chemotaxis response regulator CheY